MKGWNMIHKIKAMYDEGRGSSIKEISRTLGTSRNTVRKYLRMDEQVIEEAVTAPSRHKTLDQYRGYLKSLLSRFSGLKTPKIYRKLKDKVPDLDVSERSLRRYLTRLRPLVAAAQARYYEPVIDEVPAVQCQVDAGELRDVEIGGIKKTVYFLVFVLSYSRLMFVSLSSKPLDTEQFIQMHDEAFRFFGGTPEECVYDQTKLVVIEERFREVTLNERFLRYASQIGLDVRVCEGYDPESKGKVEAGVKYVKGDCLYGDTYANWSALTSHLSHWLDEVANVRTHGTTREVPMAVYDERERPWMKPYIVAQLPTEQSMRKVDKTGLISYRANKYSVPQAYQQGTIRIEALEHHLVIYDALEGHEIARHTLMDGKGHIVKNTDHYRDGSARIADYEASVRAICGDGEGRQLCLLLKQSSPKIYKDQLRAAIAIMTPLVPIDPGLIARLLDRPRLTATQMQDYVQAFQHNPDGFTRDTETHRAVSSAVLSPYANLAQQVAS